MNRVFSVLCAITLGLIASVSASAQNFGGIEIRDITASGESSYGYASFRFILQNTSPEDHTVRIVLTDPDGPITTISGSASVPAGSTVELPLYQPPIQFEPMRASVYIDGRRANEPLRVGSSWHGIEQQNTRHMYWGGPTVDMHHLVLVSNAIGGATVSELEDILSDSSVSSGSSYSASGTETCKVIRSSRVAANWPDDWLEYSRYLAVVVTASEFESLPSGVRDALVGAVHAGGNLIILGGTKPTEGGLASLSNQYGLNWDTKDLTAPGRNQSVVEMPSASLGFGQLFWTDNTTLVKARRGFIRQWFFDRLAETIGNRDQVVDLQHANRNMEVVEESGVPRRMTFVFLVLFAILAGPVNLIVLARSNRRTLLFVTAPLLGLLFSAMVFVYGFLYDGISSTSRLAAVTVLDQRNQIASTSSQIGFYAPLTPRSGLSFSMQTEVTPLLGTNYQRLADGQRVTMQFGDRQSLSTGWVRSRQPAHFWTREHTSRRERVLIETDAQGNPVALNGLGVPIARLLYCGPDGTIFEADTIPAGGRVPMSKTFLNADRPNRPDFYALSNRSLPAGAAARLASRPQEFIQADGYIAIIDEPLFSPLGLERVGERKAREVVIGMHASEGAESEAGQ